MHNFKPGDLAMIVGAYKEPSNIGKACELIEKLAVGQVADWKRPEGGYVGNGGNGEAWLVVGEGVLPGWGDSVGWALVDPKHLMPLRGDFTPERQKSQEVQA